MNNKTIFSALLIAALFIAPSLYAQTFTAPSPENPIKSTNWVFLANSEISMFEYDKSRVEQSDSSIIKIWLRETPLKKTAYEVRRAKMWEERSIQGYDDSLKLHPHFSYDGYERYKFSVFQEEIDCSSSRVRVLKAIDYDETGIILSDWPTNPSVSKQIRASASPESMVMNLFKTGNFSLRTN